MANAELQYLSQKYAEGELSFEEYRVQRAEILDSLSMDLSDDSDSPITLRMRRPPRISLSAIQGIGKDWWDKYGLHKINWNVKAWFDFNSDKSKTIIILIVVLITIIIIAGLITYFSSDNKTSDIRTVDENTKALASLNQPQQEFAQQMPLEPTQIDSSTDVTEITTEIDVKDESADTPDKSIENKKFSSEDDNPDVAVTVNEPAKQTLQTKKSVTEADQLIKLRQMAEELLRQDHWEQKQITEFQQQWHTLTAQEKYIASESTWFYQLKYALLRQIADNRAQVNLGGAIGIAQSELLVDFANELGFDNIN